MENEWNQALYLRCDTLREVWSQRGVNKNQSVKFPHILSNCQGSNTSKEQKGKEKWEHFSYRQYLGKM